MPAPGAFKKTGAALLTPAQIAEGWTYKDYGMGGFAYHNITTKKTQKGQPDVYQSVYGEEATEIPRDAAGPVTETGASGPSGGASGTGGPSSTLVSASAGGDGITEAQLQRKRRGRRQTNMTGGAVGMASIAKKTLVGV